MVNKNGGYFEMIKNQILPEKIFGMDRSIFVLWLQPFGMLLILIISFGLVIVPKIGEVSEKVAKIQATNKNISETNQKRKYVETVDQNEIQNSAEVLGSALLPEKNAYVLVKVIQGVASGVGYAVDDFSVSLGNVKDDNSSIKKSSTNYERIPVEVTLIGEQGRYLALVKAVERSLPIMSIDSFEMNSEANQAKIKLNISAYYLKDISNLKLESLSLADLTPNSTEMSLLNTIKEYKAITVNVGESGGSFVKYNRSDPFFTP